MFFHNDFYKLKNDKNYREKERTKGHVMATSCLFFLLLCYMCLGFTTSFALSSAVFIGILILLFMSAVCMNFPWVQIKILILEAIESFLITKHVLFKNTKQE
ncbi:hypothetical protein CXF95_25215 [Paraglaciecola sp. MB-3u-78]|nr:hypothetical protein CXF95_25215 [Paraglaciecola sp. MB-3u-78]